MLSPMSSVATTPSPGVPRLISSPKKSLTSSKSYSRRIYRDKTAHNSIKSLSISSAASLDALGSLSSTTNLAEATNISCTSIRPSSPMY